MVIDYKERKHDFTEQQSRVKRAPTDASNGSLKISAFNIRIFGVTNYGMDDVVTILSQVN